MLPLNRRYSYRTNVKVEKMREKLFALSGVRWDFSRSNLRGKTTRSFKQHRKTVPCLEAVVQRIKKIRASTCGEVAWNEFLRSRPDLATARVDAVGEEVHDALDT